MKYSIGIDIGGTKIAAALISEKGNISYRVDYPTNTSTSETVFQGVVSAIENVLSLSNNKINELEGLGVGLPGKVDTAKGIAIFQNNLPWADFPIVERLKALYPNTKIKIDNDVKVAAYAEYRVLNLDPEDMFGYLTLSTGIACTNIQNNQILRGSGFSGEVGFIPVPSSTGLKGVEKVAGGPAIQSLGQMHYHDKSITTADVFDRWRKSDVIANQIIEQSVIGVALILYQMICLLDPKAITLGGSVALKNPDFVDRVINEIDSLCHQEQKHIISEIKLSTLGGDNGLIGAGLLVIE